MEESVRDYSFFWLIDCVFVANWQGGDSSLLDSSHTDLEEEEDEESLLRERELTDKYLGQNFYFSFYLV